MPVSVNTGPRPSTILLNAPALMFHVKADPVSVFPVERTAVTDVWSRVSRRGMPIPSAASANICRMNPNDVTCWCDFQVGWGSSSQLPWNRPELTSEFLNGWRIPPRSKQPDPGGPSCPFPEEAHLFPESTCKPTLRAGCSRLYFAAPPAAQRTIRLALVTMPFSNNSQIPWLIAWLCPKSSALTMRRRLHRPSRRSRNQPCPSAQCHTGSAQTGDRLLFTDESLFVAQPEELRRTYLPEAIAGKTIGVGLAAISPASTPVRKKS